MARLDDLRDELEAAGRPRDSVQWADAPETVRVDGGYLCRRTPDGVVLTLVERGREVASELFADEHELVVALRGRLLAPARARASRTLGQTEVERFATLAETVGPTPGGDARVEVARSEVVVGGRRHLVERGTEVGSVRVRRDGEQVELALLDVESYTTITVHARWRGQWLVVQEQVDDDHVTAWYQGDPALAREAGLHGDMRDGWFGTFPISEVVDVEVRRTAYDVPKLVASTRRPYALERALQAAGRQQSAVDWAPDEGSAAARPQGGRWTVRPTRTGFAVGAADRGVFTAYDVFPTGTPAIELAVRLVASPLRRVVGLGADRAAGLLDCFGPETGHRLYPLGTPLADRSQSPSDVAAAWFVFRVVRPLPPEVRHEGAAIVLDRPIRWYVDQGHLEPVGEPMDPELAAFRDTLDQLRGWQGVSYRGLPPGPLPAERTRLVTTALTATSRSPRVATENFAVRGLWAVRGRTGRAIEDLFDDQASREVVLLPGTALTVVKVARVGDLAVVLVDEQHHGDDDTGATLTDFAAEVAGRVAQARHWPEVPVTTPGKFVGPVS